MDAPAQHISLRILKNLGRAVAAGSVVLALLIAQQLRAGVPAASLVAKPALILHDVGVGWTGGDPEHASSYKVLNTDRAGRAVRWSGCQPIRWAANAMAASPGALEDLRHALGLVSAATGIMFAEVAQTPFVPSKQRPTPAGVDLVIAWSTPSESDVLAVDVDHAYAVAAPYSEGGRYTRAAVVIDTRRQDEYRHGFGDGATRGKILLHELGHVVGLDHNDDASQVMFDKILDRGPARYGAGDLAGLAAVGCRAN